MAEPWPAFHTGCFSTEGRETRSRMLRDVVRTRVREANRRDGAAWSKVQSRGDWEGFCGPRTEALRRSLGDFPPVPERVRAEVTRTVEGDGWRIENVVFESRAGVFVTANLYLPSVPGGRMPAILIVHSHHNPRTQEELQDMGMTWARQGCAVLVMDQVGYGERRWHTPGSRQDYRFRYVTGVQLQVIGDSLMGWMVWDVMRGVDLLLSRAGVDGDRVILMGSVAGGGDPCAVAAALDDRIACAVPFNFGGPQPETVYPLPSDAEDTFNYLGGGSWESTRGLRLSGRDGFLPWVIVGSVAPRRLIYAHEFAWDRERDPVWKRLGKVWGFYEAGDRLDFAHGTGLLSGRPPEATHCNNIGAAHRRMIYPALARWFGMAAPEEVQDRRPAEALAAMTPEWIAAHRPRPLNEVFGEIGASRAEAFREGFQRLTPDARRQRLREAWASLLGGVDPASDPVETRCGEEEAGGIEVERVVLETAPGIVAPMLMMTPGGGEALRVVVGVSQAGKRVFFRERAGEIADLLNSGIAVCLPDVRGTGETASDSPRGWQSEASALASTELMLGGTMLGNRLRDLRSVLRYLRTRGGAVRVGLWGESFAPTNPPGFTDPLMDGAEQPTPPEPLGGLLALFGALYEDGVRVVVSRGMMAGYHAALWDRYCYLPYDAVVPGALKAGDLCDVAASLAPRPVRLEGLVDGRNCPVSAQALEGVFGPTRRAYADAPDRLLLTTEVTPGVADWLGDGLGDARG